MYLIASLRCESLLAGVVLLATVAGCTSKPLETSGFAVSDIDAVEVQLQDSDGCQEAEKVTSREAAKIESLLAVLRASQAAKDHKCADSGTITLHQRDGGKLEIGILAGHDSRYYEFRVYRGKQYDMYRVERTPFVDAIRELGIAELDLGTPE